MSTTRGQDLLPTDLVFQQDGHLGDAAVAALADAQPILPEDAYAHLAACDACAARVAESAMAASATHAALASAPRGEAVVRTLGQARRPLAKATRPMPVFAVAVALALAAAGVAPLLLDVPRWLPRAAVAAVRFSPVIARAAVSAAHAADSSQALAAFAGSVGVLMVALFVAFRLVARTGLSTAVSKAGSSHLERESLP